MRTRQTCSTRCWRARPRGTEAKRWPPRCTRACTCTTPSASRRAGRPSCAPTSTPRGARSPPYGTPCPWGTSGKRRTSCSTSRASTSARRRSATTERNQTRRSRFCGSPRRGSWKTPASRTDAALCWRACGSGSPRTRRTRRFLNWRTRNGPSPPPRWRDRRCVARRRTWRRRARRVTTRRRTTTGTRTDSGSTVNSTCRRWDLPRLESYV
mmetsp:Transcript_4222/g.17920  ORF Transcript_4222/g.17920 Transcript_4222/m.17920 type:complete len:211 (+) Transcript_4222:274-906(+)